MNRYQLQQQKPQNETPTPINRAIWLRQWKLVPYRLYALLWTLLPCVSMRILGQIYPKLGNEFFSLFFMLLGFVIWLIGFIYLLNKQQKLQDFNLPNAASKEVQTVITAFGIIPALFFSLQTSGRAFDICILFMIAVQFVFTWLELHDLQKKMMQTSPTDGSDIASTLRGSAAYKRTNQPAVSNRAAIGTSIKQPARKLFVRSKPV